MNYSLKEMKKILPVGLHSRIWRWLLINIYSISMISHTYFIWRAVFFNRYMLLRYNSDVIKFTHLKHSSMTVNIFTIMQPSLLSNFKIFSSPQRVTPHPLAVIPIFYQTPPLGPRQPLVYFLSSCICLCWAFHTNGI